MSGLNGVTDNRPRANGSLNDVVSEIVSGVALTVVCAHRPISGNSLLVISNGVVE